MPDTDRPNYWGMGNTELAAAWRTIDGADYATDYDGTLSERLNMVEDAILQRIGAPDTASGDEPAWQARIRAFGDRR